MSREQRPARSPLRRWQRLAVRALRGNGGDPTRGPVLDALVLLAIPMVLEMVMESVFAVADIFFVSRLGPEAVAGVALTEAVLTLVYTLAMGMSIGVTAMVARRTGEGNADAAGAATGQAMLLGGVASLLVAAVGATHAGDILRLLGGSPEVVEAGRGYASVILGTNGVILFLFLLNAAFRGAGDAAIAMRVLWLANGINLVLDPLLIFGIGPFPELGVTGAAVATSIGRGVAVAVQLHTLFRLDGRLRVLVSHLRPDRAVASRLIRLSSTGTFQVFIGTASWIGLVRILADFGAEALAGYTIAIRIVMFALLPAWGLANAAATMVGQGLGARDPARAERSVWLAGTMNLAFLGAVGVLFVVGGPAIVGAFGGDALTADYAVSCLRIVSAGFMFYAWGMVLTQSFNGAGDTLTPTVLNLACFWLWEIPLAWWLSGHTELGAAGVFTAIAVAYATLAVAAIVVFRRGRWKLAEV
jgi:putative MATE family efflux protein